MKLVGSDPLPYGLEANRRTIEALILYAFQQSLIPRKLAVEDVFLPLNARTTANSRSRCRRN